VGIYLHGLLIGVARAQSYTQAYMAAARQALSVVERMIQRSLVLDCVDGNISLLPMTEESKASALNFGTSCRLCLKSANSR
jgi:hypothetical protein